MTAQTFNAIPPIRMQATASSNPLKSVMITVFTLKVAVAAVLLATVSLAPPLSADGSYTTVIAAAD